MREAIAQPIEYWAAGGPLLAPIAAVCFAIWFYFLRSHARLSAAVIHGVPPGAGQPALTALRRDFVVLAGLTAVAPLLGLLGTVDGMITTFNAVSCAGGGTGAGVASGVSRSLITTQFGLVVAIPGLFGLSRLHHLYERVERDHDFRCAHVALTGAARKGAAG